MGEGGTVYSLVTIMYMMQAVDIQSGVSIVAEVQFRTNISGPEREY